MNPGDKIVNFCTAVKRGFGTIVDASVKPEYERMFESALEPKDLSTLLAILEKYDLLDKKASVNKVPGFYQNMHKKMSSGEKF